MGRPLPESTDPSDPSVAAILDRAVCLTDEEARPLDAAVREGPDLEPLAQMVMDDHQRYLNNWAMFDCWSHPWDEMVEARTRVAFALGYSTTARPVAVEPDDGTVAWGAATAAAYAVLGSGRACAEPRLREAWERVIDTADPIARPTHHRP